MLDFRGRMQVRLAEQLEQEGVDIIQTEGGKCSTPSKAGVLGLIEKVAYHIFMHNSLIYCKSFYSPKYIMFTKIYDFHVTYQILHVQNKLLQLQYH